MKDERNRPNFAVLLRLKTPPDSNEMQRDGSDTHFPVACSSSFYLKERGGREEKRNGGKRSERHLVENGSVSKGIEKSNIVDNNNNLKKFREREVL